MVLKVGVVGQKIVKIHAESYINDPLAELVAVCDIIKERADVGAKKYGVKSYYSLQDMLERETDLDIVDVCTGGHEWGSLHYEPTMLALEYGKHVLVEKPLSNDIYEAREMVAKAKQKKLFFSCDLPSTPLLCFHIFFKTFSQIINIRGSRALTSLPFRIDEITSLLVVSSEL
jgi:predicted dehydrogenase